MPLKTPWMHSQAAGREGRRGDVVLVSQIQLFGLKRRVEEQPWNPKR